MKHSILFAAAMMLLPPLAAAQAQGVPRIKARIVSFDGKRLTVIAGTGKDAQTLSVGVLPTTRYVSQEAIAPGDIKRGDYAGATIAKLAGGKWQAQEVHVFPAMLKGSDEGLFTLPSDSAKSIVDGVVSGDEAGALTFEFRGAGPQDGSTCTGHAPADPKQGCRGTIQAAIGAQTPVLTLKGGDKSLLVPGAVIALSIMAGRDGRPVTPGLTVEMAGANESGARNAGHDAPSRK